MATQTLPFEDIKRFAARIGADSNLVQGRSGFCYHTRIAG